MSTTSAIPIRTSSPAPPPRLPLGQRLKRLLKKCTLALFAMFLALLLAEGLVRWFAPQALAVPWQDSMEGVTCPRPNVHGRHFVPGCFDVTVTFSSQRFRGQRLYTSVPPPDTIRVAVLGDSFTFGYGAKDDQTYPAQLERILAEKLKATVEVINAGNGGTGTGDQALWYERWVREFRPQVVIVSVTSNDVDDDMARLLFQQSEAGQYVPRSWEEIAALDASLRATRGFVNAIPGYGFLAQHSQLFALLRNTASGIISARRSKSATRVDQAVDLFNAKQVMEKGLPLQSGEIAWLRRRCDASGIRLVVVFLPSRECVYPKEPSPDGEIIRTASAAITANLSSVCAGENVPYFDVSESMLGRAAQAGHDLYYHGSDSHPNPSGYRAFAEIIADYLIKNRVISAPVNK